VSASLLPIYDESLAAVFLIKLGENYNINYLFNITVINDIIIV